MSHTSLLKENLQLGLSVVSEPWSYSAKNWVTCVHAADIDNDGDIEILIGSRDGRVRALTSKGLCRWERIVGNKAWIKAVVGIIPSDVEATSVSVLVGTQDGKVYALNRDGQTISKDRQTVYSFDKNGRAIDQEHDEQAFWYSSRSATAIRYLAYDLKHTSQIVIDSEDHTVHTLDYFTGAAHQIFEIKSNVSAVFACDMNGNGNVETLIGSNDQHLYVLNHMGTPKDECDIQGQIHTMHAADLERDGHMKILLGIDGKTLWLYMHHTPKRLHTFPNRFACIFVADVDGDGHHEILVGSEDKYLYVLNTQGKEIWRHYIGQCVSAIYTRDIDQDGQVEVLVGAQDNKLHVLHIQPIKNLDEKIRGCYQELGQPPFTEISALSNPQCELLQHIVEGAKPASKPSTLENIQKLLNAKKPSYLEALSEALLLKEKRLQLLWQKNLLTTISSMCLGDISIDSRKEVIAGTETGMVYAFNAAGGKLWSLPIGPQIAALQTCYLSKGNWAEIIAYSTDSTIHILSGVKYGKISGEYKETIKAEDWISSLCVSNTEKDGPLHIILGSESKKIYLYDRDMHQPPRSFPTLQAIRLVRARVAYGEDELAIVAGGIDSGVLAYTLAGKHLWSYPIEGRVEAIALEDIDGDGKVEVIVGSQGCNIYVLDFEGFLKWRYYLPDIVLSVAVYTLKLERDDNRVRVIAGCGDGNLYIFSSDGDLLQTYESSGRVLAISVEDINGDRQVELVVGSEETLAVFQVVNQDGVQELIQQCWTALQKHRSTEKLIEDFQKHTSPYLRMFVVQKIAEQRSLTEQDWQHLQQACDDGAIEVRKALVDAAIHHFDAAPLIAQEMLTELFSDAEQEVRVVLVQQIGHLIKRDVANHWDVGLKYLQRFAHNGDRVVRRTVMRVLDSLMKDLHQQHRWVVFEMLVTGTLDAESEWVRQEAARALAHFLDQHYSHLITNLNLLIAKDFEADKPEVARAVKAKTLQQIAYFSQTSFIKHIFQTLDLLLFDLNENNVLEVLDKTISALNDVKWVRFGEETLTIYKELYLLINVRAVEDIAQYQYTLNSVNPNSDNVHFPIMTSIFKQLSHIPRVLRMYLRHSDIKDSVSNLLEAIQALDKMYKFAEQEYATVSLGEPLSKLPDHTILKMLLERWKFIITAELLQLRGNVELTPEVQTKRNSFEEQIAIWLVLRNTSNSTAEAVYVELLHNNQYEVIGRRIFETEAILARDEFLMEFTIRPLTSSPRLFFEMVYTETDGTEKSVLFDEQVQLYVREQHDTFTTIDNPYSTGLPATDLCYGRETDLAFLRENLTHATARTLLILYGLRRAGKTTMLFQLAHTSLLAPHIPVLIDMQREVYVTSESRFFYKIASYIVEALKDRAISVPLPEEEAFEKHFTETFDSFLAQVEKNLQQQRLVLMIDEFEQLEKKVEKKVFAPEFFEYLRSLMQHHPKLTFLLAGNHTVQELTSDYWSVFFNIAHHYHLGKLSEHGAIKLITVPLHGYLEYEAYALQKIRQLTADQPYLINIVCRSLVDYCNQCKKDYITINDVNAVLDEIMQKGQNHFRWVWSQSSQQEQYVLAIIAETGKDEGRLLSLIEIEEQYGKYLIPYKRNHVLNALKNLKEREVIQIVPDPARENTVDSERYRISVGLIRQWLYQTKAVKDVLREEEHKKPLE